MKTSKTVQAELTRDAAWKSMKRILCQFPVNHDTKPYFDAIFEQVQIAAISPETFSDVCLRLAGTMEPYKPPMAAEYLAAARRIKAGQNERRQNCEKCRGLGLYLVKVFDRHAERMVDAYTPCLECKP